MASIRDERIWIDWERLSCIMFPIIGRRRGNSKRLTAEDAEKSGQSHLRPKPRMDLARSFGRITRGKRALRDGMSENVRKCPGFDDEFFIPSLSLICREKTPEKLHRRYGASIYGINLLG